MIHHKLFLSFILFTATLFAFDGFDVSSANYRLLVGEIPIVTAPDKPTSVTVTVFNKTDKTTKAAVTIHKLVDDWKVVGIAVQETELPPKTQKDLSFTIVSGPFVFDAHYPVHAQAVFTAEGVQPDADTAERAAQKGINLLGTGSAAFDFCLALKDLV